MSASKDAELSRSLGPEFWNLVAAVICGYGAVTLLILAFVGFHRVLPNLEPLDIDGLAILCLSTGTPGLLVSRDMFVGRSWWREAQFAGCCQNTVCAAAALWGSNERLALLIGAIAIGEWVLNKAFPPQQVGGHDED